MNKPRRIAVLAAALAAASAVAWAAAATEQQQPAAQDPRIEFERYTLDNGLEVILHRDNSVPLVAINIWYHVGSGDETPGKSGFAHLFEHMLFQGSKHVGEDRHFDILRQVGASGVNGTTNTDRTNYFEVVPSHQLETALWLESDRMGYMLPLLTQKSLDNQISVVRNERRENYDNVAYRRALFKRYELLYPEGHPYRYLTIGRHEDLENASLQDVITFYKQWYVPANATLVVAGDFDTAEVKKLIDRWFGSFPRSVRPKRSFVPAPALASTQTAEVQDPFAKLRQMDWSWHSPAAYADGEAEMEILASALGASGTGRLYKILVIEKQLAQSVSVSQRSSQGSGTFNVSVMLRSDADAAEVKRIVEQEIAKVIAEPITQRELDRVIVRLEASFVWGLESLMTRAQVLQNYNHYVGNPDYITQDLDRYRKTSVARVRDAAARFLSKPHVHVVTVPAEKGGQ